jgi:hypothetical protein
MARPLSRMESKKFKIVAPVNADQKKMAVALALLDHGGNEAEMVRCLIRDAWNMKQYGTKNPDKVEPEVAKVEAVATG